MSEGGVTPCLAELYLVIVVVTVLTASSSDPVLHPILAVVHAQLTPYAGGSRTQHNTHSTIQSCDARREKLGALYSDISSLLPSQQSIPYSGFLSQEKTFANYLKIDFR